MVQNSNLFNDALKVCIVSMYSKHINEDNDMFLQTIKGVRKFLNKLDDVFSIVFKQKTEK